MAKFRKKPVEDEEIDAVIFIDDPEEIISIQDFLDQEELAIDYSDPNNPILKIETDNGVTLARLGDYILKTGNGEFYSFSPFIFEKIYEAVE